MTFSTMLSTMSAGMIKTALIFVLTLVGSLPLGMVVALLRKSKFAPVRGIINIGNWRFPAIITGFVLNYAAYFAEIYRGGIESIPKGQYEAAEVLGYTKFQTFMRIILPQVAKIIMPSVTNEVITLVKDTSLAFTLAYQEVFSLAKQISASQTSFMPFVIAGVFYFVANYLVEVVMARIEKSMDYYK